MVLRLSGVRILVGPVVCWRGVLRVLHLVGVPLHVGHRRVGERHLRLLVHTRQQLTSRRSRCRCCSDLKHRRVSELLSSRQCRVSGRVLHLQLCTTVIAAISHAAVAIAEQRRDASRYRVCQRRVRGGGWRGRFVAGPSQLCAPVYSAGVHARRNRVRQ